MREVVGRAARACCAALLFLLAGCGQPTGVVSGKVLLDNEPVPGGRVSFVASNGKSYGGEISTIMPRGSSARHVASSSKRPRR